MLIKNKDIEGLLKALEYHDVDIRNKAAVALGELKDVRAITPLIQTLNDQNGHVSNSALEALVKIGNQGTEYLIVALKDENMNIRFRAVLALGDIGDERAVKPLINSLTDREAAVRYNATIALGNIGVESCISLSR